MLCLAFVLAGLVLGAYGMHRYNLATLPPIVQEGEGPPNDTAIQSVDVDKTTINTKFVYTVNYAKSVSTRTKEEKIPHALAGLTKEELADFVHGWTIDYFGKDLVSLSRNVDSYSPENYTLSISYEDQSLALYGYDEDGQVYLVRLLDMPLANLEPWDVDELDRGITVFGEEELNRLLENYSS
ncbi:MAG: hypothetical protein FWG10_06880 [Eubacteriaceae bacterium]|nr:hypothetical protein [Eubacteriaceae bacterium]